jgi:hypothetical protein
MCHLIGPVIGEEYAKTSGTGHYNGALIDGLLELLNDPALIVGVLRNLLQVALPVAVS